MLLISALTSASAHGQNDRSGWPPARFVVEGQPPIEVTLYLSADDRRHETAIRTLKVLTAWFGPFPDSTLAIVDLPWGVELNGAAYPGVVVTRTRWLAPARDLTAERTLVAALARQYWRTSATPAEFDWFAEALSLYSGTRAIHELLEGRNFATQRAFGGFVSHVVDSINWSPNSWQPQPRVRHFSEVEEPDLAPWRFASAAPDRRAQRAALALHTLERYVGWPALQAALATLRERAGQQTGSPALLAQVLSEQRGVDLAWFVDEVLQGEHQFDYGVDTFTSTLDFATGRYRTAVGVRRHGDGVFAGTSRPRDGARSSSKSLSLLVRFDDGTQVTDFWDGRDEQVEFEYRSASRAVSATIDPGLMLLIDADRGNNQRTLERAVRPEGWRLTLTWLTWLQDLMLSYSALV